MKKWIALLCAVSMMMTFAACGEETNESSSEAATEATTEATTEEATTEEATTEEVTEEATTEEVTEEAEATEEESTEEAEATEEESEAAAIDVDALLAGVDQDALAAELTQSETVEGITLSVSPNWTKTEEQGYPMWYLDDMSGAFFVQEFDAAEMGISGMDEKTTLEMIGAAMGGMATVTNEDWITINGADSYSIIYTMDVGEVTTVNRSVFFYAGESIYGVTFTDLSGEATVIGYADPILETIAF